MPQDVIDRVHNLGCKSDKVVVEFRDRSGTVMPEDDSDESDVVYARGSDGKIEDSGGGGSIPAVGETHGESEDPNSGFEGEDTEPSDDQAPIGDTDNHHGESEVQRGEVEEDGVIDDAILAPEGIEIDCRNTEQAGITGVPDKGEEEPTTAESIDPGRSASEAQIQERLDMHGLRTVRYNLRERKSPRYDISTLLLMKDIKGTRSVIADDLRSATEVLVPAFDVAALGDGAFPGNNELSTVIMTQFIKESRPYEMRCSKHTNVRCLDPTTQKR